MQRLTSKQKDVFDIVVAKGGISLQKMADYMKEKEPVTRQAVFDRLKNIIRKGYLIKEGSCYIPTSKGLEQVIKDGGKTKHSYYDNKTNWGKASPTDDTSEEAES